MRMSERPKAYLALADGHIFEGRAIGKQGAVTLGELVFNTATGGYIETLTDPSYFGQIVLQTFPLIGDYGFIPDDMESGRSHVRGYVVRELCDTPSNFRSAYALEDFLLAQGVVGVAGVDTRAITTLLREAGVMNAMIVPDPAQIDWEALKTYRVENAVASVSTQTRYVVPAQNVPAGETPLRIALMDYGAKRYIAKELAELGCDVTVLPQDTSAEDVLALAPDGVMLTNGPGDPSECAAPIAELKKLFGRVPMFGICLGHQLLALANGGKTYKLKYGHRGVNQPVRELATGSVKITCQNHGYAVDGASLPIGEVSHENANDHTCEGVNYPGNKAFTVQFHPEACAGPLDTRPLFLKFIAMMKDERGARHAS